MLTDVLNRLRSMDPENLPASHPSFEILPPAFEGDERAEAGYHGGFLLTMIGLLLAALWFAFQPLR